MKKKESIRQKVFQFLAKNPYIELKMLTKNKEFSGCNYSTLNNYFKEFRDKYDDFLRYNLMTKNSEREQVIEYSKIYSILEMYPILVVFFFMKMFYLTLGSKEKDYSFVDIYNNLFEKIITMTDFTEISDFSLNIYQEVTDVYNEMNLKEVNIHNKIYEFVKIIDEINVVLQQTIFDDDGNLVPFRKKSEKNECFTQVKHFIKAKILSHLFTELYIKADHLRTRNIKYIYRDYLKACLEFRKSETIRARTTQKIKSGKVVPIFKDYCLEKHLKINFLEDFNKAVSEIYKDNEPIMLDYAFICDDFFNKPEYCKDFKIERGEGI